MIKVPFEDIIARIKEKSGISEDELVSRINDKKKQLAGLISNEGAAHIVANELGVKIFDEVSGKLQIKNVLAGMRDVETAGRAVQIYEAREFNSNGRQGKVATLLIGDETGTIRVVLWGSQADNVRNIKSNDVIKIVGGYVRENNGRKEIHLNERSQLAINPLNITIGEVASGKGVELKKPSRKAIIDIKESESNVEILGTLVQAFEPRFFEICPKCSKRARMSEEGVFVCSEHGQVSPEYSYVFNAVIDDGTDNIRAVFFRQQMEKLFQRSREEVLKFKDEPQGFEAVKNEILGSIVKLSGRANKNEAFGRVEFVANSVEVNPDPKEELEMLEKTITPAEQSQANDV